jgi:hypothetical protein
VSLSLHHRANRHSPTNEIFPLVLDLKPFPHLPQAPSPSTQFFSIHTITMPCRIVQLHVPAHGATFDELMITPSMEFKHFVESAKATFRAYNLKDVLPHDINGKPLHGKDGYPSLYDAIAHGERILIAISKDETISAEPPLEVVLYLEDNSLPKAWKVCILQPFRAHLPLSSLLSVSRPDTALQHRMTSKANMSCRRWAAKAVATTLGLSSVRTPSRVRTLCA